VSDHARPGASAALVSALARGTETGFDVRAYQTIPDDVLAGDLDERPITADQTNASVVVGGRVVVKWMREPMADPRAPLILGHLVEVGFTRMPTPYAAVFRDDRLIALVTEFLPAAVDGWEWCTNDLINAIGGGEPDFPMAVATLAADLHAALATPSSVFPNPVIGGSNPGWGRAGLELLASAVTAMAGTDDEEFLRTIEPYLADQIRRADAIDLARFMHIHGDLHVGQILRWRGGLAVIDFDGNPTVDSAALEPATRDVAQLRTSVLHVGEIANRLTEGRHRQAILEWGRLAMPDMLDAYRNALRVHGKLEVFSHGLLRPFEAEQECRELLYAARFLPRWRYAPIGVLRDWHRGVA